ncbi:MAG: hypothetical protein Q8922_12895 [Bacteroidota bacterium]|nr:hypothetical protein [Bacteroidota bacterium]MDP4234470.1 hypothetical protein [Bacteroidota bacterium]MDP4244182.1 hypothetical protein [Bacteroidota bacterium]MDP4288823.1 hypothetical protein [Bacteroidota bacterium]
MKQCIVVELTASECLDRTPDEIIDAVKQQSIDLGPKRAFVTFHSLEFVRDLLLIAEKPTI